MAGGLSFVLKNTEHEYRNRQGIKLESLILETTAAIRKGSQPENPAPSRNKSENIPLTC